MWLELEHRQEVHAGRESRAPASRRLPSWAEGVRAHVPSPLTLRELVTESHPGARILTASQPVPVLGDANLVALFDDDAKARAAVQRLESVVADDARLGVVTFEPSTADRPAARDAARHRTESAGEVDPEGVAHMTARRASVGAVVAFVVTAIVVGVVVWLVTGQLAAGVAAGLGVGLLVSAVGAMLGAFSGFGGSDAWRQTFSPPGASLTMVAVVDVPARTLDEASMQLRDGALQVSRLDAAGRPR